jgi:hypothetical protein
MQPRYRFQAARYSLRVTRPSSVASRCAAEAFGIGSGRTHPAQTVRPPRWLGVKVIEPGLPSTARVVAGSPHVRVRVVLVPMVTVTVLVPPHCAAKAR